MKELQALMNIYSASGTIDWICIRPLRTKDVHSINSVLAVKREGLEGDHYKAKDGARQVTLIQKEHLEAVASFMRKQVDPALARRNIVVKGFNLNSLKGKRFKVGSALFEYSGECHPCSRMETNIGAGAYNAMRGHGGITARIIESGEISVGDSLIPIE